MHMISRQSKPLRITREVFKDIHSTIGSYPAEQGGVLGGNREDEIVKNFYYDQSARRTSMTYSPDSEFLNKLFKKQWNPKGINLLGFVHSHPPSLRHPSSGDIKYAQNILSAIPELDRLLLPIVISEAETGNFEMIPYAVIRQGNKVQVEEMELEIVDDLPTTAGISVTSSCLGFTFFTLITLIISFWWFN